MSDKPIVEREPSHSSDEVIRGVSEPGGVGQTFQRLLFQGGPLIALILLVIYLSFATPHFFTVGNWVNVVRQTAITAILAVSQTLVIISSGIDLSVAAVAAATICQIAPTR